MSHSRAQRLEQGMGIGLFVLVALMPFHAFLSVWLGSLTGHESLIQAWKEGLLVILGALTCILVALEPKRLERLRQPWVLVSGCFVSLALLVTFIMGPSLEATIFGAKTDLEFIFAALIALLISRPELVRRLEQVILASSTIVVAFGLLQMFALPSNFLTHFGYGKDTIEPYWSVGADTSALRFASTLGGPNQLGTYLILPLCLGLATAWRTRRWWLLALPAATSIVLVGTYSRGAWIGAAVAVALTIFVLTPRRHRMKLLAAGGSLALLMIVAIVMVLHQNNALDRFFLHSTVGNHNLSSDEEHALSLHNGLHAVFAQPLGHGLGTAGPTAFHTGTGNVIENYFLQIGYEIGVLGALGFILVVLLLAGALWRHAPPVAAALIGVSIVGIVLPSWTDSSTALIAWTLAGSYAAHSIKQPSHKRA